MQQVKDRHLVDTEIDLIKMVTMDNSGNTTVREFISLSSRDDDGNIRYFLRFTEPEDVRGVSLLTIEKPDDLKQWLYLPALGEPRSISGSARSGNFMGSDFTFEDLRRENPADHSHHRLRDDTDNGQDVYQILSAPDGADIRQATNYAHRILTVDKDAYTILNIDFYDEGKRLRRTFKAYDYNSDAVDGTSLRPYRAVMTDHERGSNTIMTVLRSRLNVPVDDSVFTVEELKSYSPDEPDPLLKLFDGK